MWIVKWDGVEVNSDDFLIEDLESIEKATGVPWSISNCYKDVKTAKAFLAVALMHLGKTDKEVAEVLKTVTLGTLKNTFEFKSEDDDEAATQETDPTGARPVKNSRSSRRGRPISGGSRPISDDNVSEMSSAS